jgi:hypothetical protein
VCAGKPTERVENFNGRPIFYMDVDKSIPRITAKAFLSSISSALGYKMRIDYKSGGVTFYSLDEVDNSSVFIEHSKYNVTFNADIPVVGVMNFAQYKPLEVDTDNGKEVYPYTDFENVEISKGSAKSENRISNKCGTICYFSNKWDTPLRGTSYITHYKKSLPYPKKQ